MALSQREKRLLLVPAVLGGIYLFYSYVHEPLFARRAEAAQTSQKTAQDLKRDQQKLAKEGNLQIRREAVAAREQVVDAWVPGKNSAALLIWYLSQAETATGARVTGITVGERKEVTVSEAKGAGGQAQPGGQPQGSPPAPAQGNGQPQGNEPAQPAPGAQPPAQPGAQPQGPVPSTIDPTLMVLTLELKVEARFLQHLQFNQALEEMPIFLSTEGIGLAPGKNEETMEIVSQLVQSGEADMAAAVLGGSPTLEGTYQINLTFKGAKMGPTTESMAFGQQAGRSDPFALDAVEDFVEMLQQHYAAQKDLGAKDGQPNQGAKKPAPIVPGTKKGQMG
ncbi:MAG: hypothetical protein K0R39_2367 [Symbiobacteriaceae bacterium]|jgi:hypothetical protein|nr:hypothetical protein [Symbiobacteriaceae bacterium]